MGVTFEGKPCKNGHTTRYTRGSQGCAVCCRMRTTAWRLGHPQQVNARARVNRARAPVKTKSREYRLRKLYDISPAQFEAMLRLQDGKCAGCETSAAGVFHVDHDHATGAVRALLCAGCNRGMGYMKDNSETLRRLARILDEAAAGPRFKTLLDMFSPGTA